MSIPSTNCNDCQTLPAGQCGTDVGIVTVTDPAVDSYGVFDVINKHCNGGYKVYDICQARKSKSFFRTMMFDSIDGNGEEIPADIRGKVEMTLTLNGKYIQWGERLRTANQSEVTLDVTASNIIPIVEPRVFNVGDNVMIKYCDGCCTVTEFRTVEAANTGATAALNNIEVDGAPLTIDVDGCEPMVYFINHPYKCGDTVQSTNVFDTIVDKQSYFQLIAREVCFSEDELNICYSTPRGAVDYVESKFAFQKQSMYDELLGTFFYGTNEPEAGGKAAQTMGILSEINRVNQSGKTIITDLSGTKNVDLKIMAMIEELEKITLCRDDITAITVVANDKFFKSLILANSAWSRLTGCYKVCDAEANGTTKSFGGAYDIVLPWSQARVTFYSDAALSNYYKNESIAIAMPEGFFAAYSRPNKIVDMRIAQRNEIFEWREIPKGREIACDTCYQVHGFIAFAHVGVDSGMYRQILGL